MTYRPRRIAVEIERVPAPQAAQGWRRLIETVIRVLKRIESETPAPANEPEAGSSHLKGESPKEASE